MKKSEMEVLLKDVVFLAKRYRVKPEAVDLKLEMEKLLLPHLTKLLDKERSSWEGCVDRQGGSFTEEEIEAANRWI